MNPSEKTVRNANRRVFDAKDFDAYDSNSSIFEHSRQAEIEMVLKSTPRRERLLDIGCGTGNILRLAEKHFEKCIGVDLSPRMLGELHRRSTFRLAAAEAFRLPFRREQFDAVTMYALIHHLLDPQPAFQAAYRVLRPGGMIYMDHDPNYFFGRFYHIYYRVRYAHRPGFGTWDAELSEWHHTRTGGLNPDEVKAKLERTGFSKVTVGFRITTNPDLPIPFRMARSMMRALVRIYPFKSCHTHFWVTARK